MQNSRFTSSMFLVLLIGCDGRMVFQNKPKGDASATFGVTFTYENPAIRCGLSGYSQAKYRVLCEALGLGANGELAKATQIADGVTIVWAPPRVTSGAAILESSCAETSLSQTCDLTLVDGSGTALAFDSKVKKDGLEKTVSSELSCGSGSLACPTNQNGNPMPLFFINSGGPAVVSFNSDAFFIGGSTYSLTNSIDTSRFPDSAGPEALYQDGRFGAMTYLFPGLTPGALYLVRLHFAEPFWTGPGMRVFDVSMNGNLILHDFDVFAEAGGEFVALVKDFPAHANSQGRIVLDFTSVIDNPIISGIQVTGFQ